MNKKSIKLIIFLFAIFINTQVFSQEKFPDGVLVAVPPVAVHAGLALLSPVRAAQIG